MPMESVVTLLVAVEDFVEEPGPLIVKPAVDLPPRSESSHPSLGPGRGRETTGIHGFCRAALKCLVLVAAGGSALSGMGPVGGLAANRAPVGREGIRPLLG